MATLHVRNIPDELYELLRERAAANGRSIGAETCQLLYERLVAAAGRPRSLSLPGLRRQPVGQPGPFTRFTTEARQAIAAAQREARALRHDHVGTEHLLLGVLDAEEAKEMRARMIPGDEEVEEKIPFTPDAKRALEQSMRAAFAEGAPLIEPRHLRAALQGSVPPQPVADPTFRVVLLAGSPESWESQLNEVAGLGYELVQIVESCAIFRR
ncbi:MAG: Arc family DNA-binding protein [Acidobacteriota bacterium]|nr:Arc family DNA-binding protein [Acidobacteriota bacterium]